MEADPHPDLMDQIARLGLEPTRPLVVCDADEVLFSFMAAFERFLHGRGLYYVWRSYALFGNIRRRADGAALEQAEIRELIAAFYVTHIETLEPVPGAATALRALSRRAAILVLTNLPPHHVAARGRALERHGLPYPVLGNTGGKGPAMRCVAGRVRAPVYFVDDSPHHHASVATHAAAVVRIHFVAERRLAGLVAPAAESHYRIDTWYAARAVIEADLARRGP